MPAWTLTCLTVGPLQMNAWLLSAPGTGPDHPGEAMLVDPGDEPQRLLEAIDNAGCRLRYLVATHGHFDHVGAAAAVQARCGLPLLCHADDLELIARMPQQQAMFGFPASDVPLCSAELTHGRRLPFADGELLVAHVPGHSPGHVMLSWAGHALVGDCIFAGSVGRTDLPGGSFAALENSIRERIYALPDATILHPGHGPDTTVGREKLSNPYVPAG